MTDSGYAFNNNCGLNDTLSYNVITSEWELQSITSNPTAITEIEINNISDYRLYDLLGRETKGTKNEVLFYIYDDGTVEKRIVIE